MIWVAIWEWGEDIGICGAYATCQNAIDDITNNFLELDERVENIVQDEMNAIVYTNLAKYRIERHLIK